MAEKDTASDQPRRGNERQGRAPYQQLAADIAPYLAEQQFPGANGETGNGIGAGEVPSENNNRRRRNHYQELVADMAQTLADVHVPVGNNNATDGAVNGDDAKSGSGARESPSENNNRRRRNHYQELAANMAQPLTDVHVPGGNDDATDGAASGEGRTENQPKNRQLKAAGNRTAKRGGRNPYFDLAADISGPLAELRTPGTSDESGSQREVQVQPQPEANDSFPYQESLSEYDPDASCGSAYESGRDSSFQTETHSEEMGARYGHRGEDAESVVQQESLSEYNPDSTCGSGYYENCGHSSSYSETRSEEMGTRYDQREQDSMYYRGEGTESIAQQESLSEYNENATCVMEHGFHRSEYDEISEYSSIQTEESYERSYGTGDFPSKSPAQFDTTYEECHSQIDGEPYSKRTKPNPEVTKELSLSSTAKSYSESTQESIPEVFSANSEQREAISVKNEEINTRYNEVQPMPRNVTALEPCLSSEFENMNLGDNISVESPGLADFSMMESAASSSQSNQRVDAWKTSQTSPEKDGDRGAVKKYNSSSVLENDSSLCSENVDNSQGTRPKASGKVPRGKKFKKPKQNTKNAYTELAKDVAGDLSAMNKQLAKSQATPSGASTKQGSEKEQEFFDGSTAKKSTSGTETRRAVEDISSTREHQQLFDGSTVETATSDVSQLSLESHANNTMVSDDHCTRERQELFDRSTVETVTSDVSQLSLESHANNSMASDDHCMRERQELFDGSTVETATSDVSQLSLESHANSSMVSDDHCTGERQELFNGSTVETATSDVSQLSLESHANNSMVSDDYCMRELQELFDGSSVQTEMSNGTSLHSYPLEREVLNTSQHKSVMTDEKLRKRDVRDEREDFSMLEDTRETEDSRADSRQTNDFAAEQRSQIAEQQRMIDNMAPELQALVIQMMQRDEEEQRGNAPHAMYLNRPVPPRTLPQARGENANQEACAKGALKKPGGKKSRMGSKSKGHYAGIMAPQLAAVNAAMVNGHVKEPQGATERIHPKDVSPSTMDESSDQEPVSHHEANGIDPILTGARPRDHLSFRGSGLQSRDQSRGHASLPDSGASGRDTTDGRGAFSLAKNVSTSSKRGENGNKNQGTCIAINNIVISYIFGLFVFIGSVF